jgi:hypothetical protein
MLGLRQMRASQRGPLRPLSSAARRQRALSSGLVLYAEVGRRLALLDDLHSSDAKFEAATPARVRIRSELIWPMTCV